MEPRCISASEYRGWKTWGPVVITIFFGGVGIYYWISCAGLYPPIDYAVSALLLFLIVQHWWIAKVLRFVEIDEEFIHVSNRGAAEQIPLDRIEGVIDRTKLKRIPSTIFLERGTSLGSKVRFFPATPADGVFEELRAHAIGKLNKCQQDAASNPGDG